MKIEKFLSESPVFTIELAQQSLSVGMLKALRRDRINLLQGLALVAIFFEQDASPLPSQLAAALGTTRTNMSHCLTRLETLRLVRRELNPSDSRSYRIALTPEGIRTARRLVRLFHQTQLAFERQVGARALAEAITVLRALRIE